jgi:hypothetical protein
MLLCDRVAGMLYRMLVSYFLLGGAIFLLLFRHPSNGVTQGDLDIICTIFITGGVMLLVQAPNPGDR